MNTPLPVPQTDFTPIEALAMSEIANIAMIESIRLGLFDVFGETPLSAGEIAAKFNFEEAKTEALLDLLAAHGLLAKKSGGYANSDMASEYLRSDSPYFMGKAIEFNRKFLLPIGDDFRDLLRGVISQREKNDDDWAVEDCMEGAEQFARIGPVQYVSEFIAGLPGFPELRLMCDLGGNHGCHSMALLDRNPYLQSELADLPDVATAAKVRIAAHGYAERMTAKACDLRESSLPPEKYDLVLASHVLYGFMDNLGETLAMIRSSLRTRGWFVSHHMNPDGRNLEPVTQGREFITRMAGYATHVIDREFLEERLRIAGFDDFTAAPAGRSGSSLILAARKA